MACFNPESASTILDVAEIYWTFQWRQTKRYPDWLRSTSVAPIRPQQKWQCSVKYLKCGHRIKFFLIASGCILFQNPKTKTVGERTLLNIQAKFVCAWNCSDSVGSRGSFRPAGPGRPHRLSFRTASYSHTVRK